MAHSIRSVGTRAALVLLALVATLIALPTASPTAAAATEVPLVDGADTGSGATDATGGPGLASRASTETTPGSLTPEERFVEAAYADFLGRAPTESERTGTAAQLVAGTIDRWTVVRLLVASSAWSTAIVEELYLATLDRPGDPTGTAFWADRISTGSLTVAQVAARFFASDEYVRRFPSGDVGAWVDDLYREVLGRPSDEPGRAHWVGVVAARGRTPVAQAIYQSPESARARVDRLYQVLLGRAADASGLAHWAPRVVAYGDIALAVQLGASAEYLARAQTR